LSPYTDELDAYTSRSRIGAALDAASSSTCVASMLFTV